MLLAFDITERETAEQTRREFTANVSHELKTPLTSIMGYAEIIENDIVKPQDVCPFAGKIRAEARRLLLYTPKSAKEIAYLLGYEDTAAFSRFFAKMNGESITGFRQREKRE